MVLACSELRLQTRRVCCTAKLCKQIVDLQASNPSICKPHKSFAFVRKPIAANLRFASQATQPGGCVQNRRFCNAKLCKATGL